MSACLGRNLRITADCVIVYDLGVRLHHRAAIRVPKLCFFILVSIIGQQYSHDHVNSETFTNIQKDPYNFFLLQVLINACAWDYCLAHLRQ